MLVRRSNLLRISRLLVIFLLMCIIAVPFLNMLSTAVSSEREVFLNPGRMIWVPKPIRWDNFYRALTFKNTNFIRAFFNTLFLIVVNITTTVIVSSWVAFGFARIPFRGRRVFFMLGLRELREYSCSGPPA